MVKNLPAMWEKTSVRSLGWENPLEKEMASHSSILAWKNSMDRGAFFKFQVYNIVIQHLVAQLRLTLCNPMDYSLPGSSVQVIITVVQFHFCIYVETNYFKNLN